MMKLAGSVFVFLGTVLVWRRLLAKQRQKRDTLWAVMSGLRQMQEEIRMARTPMPRLLEALAAQCQGGEGGRLFADAAAGLRRGAPLPLAWAQAVEPLPLEEQVRKILLDIPLKGDEESMCKGISLAIYRLSKYAEEQDAARRGARQRTAALCFSGGALLVILLI